MQCTVVVGPGNIQVIPPNAPRPGLMLTHYTHKPLAPAQYYEQTLPCPATTQHCRGGDKVEDTFTRRFPGKLRKSKCLQRHAKVFPVLTPNPASSSFTFFGTDRQSDKIISLSWDFVPKVRFPIFHNCWHLYLNICTFFQIVTILLSTG